MAFEQEFREIVDNIIQQQVETCERTGRSWLDYKKYATAAGLRFASLDRSDGHYEPFPLRDNKEHLWGVAPDSKLRTGVFSGRLAIISFANQPGLYRYWSIDSQAQDFSPSISRQLSEEEAASMVDWVKSPHLHQDGLDQVARLSEGEAEVISLRVRQDADAAAELRDALERLDRARRLPADAWNTLIN